MSCAANGVTFLGGAVVTLRLMAVRAAARRPPRDPAADADGAREVPVSISPAR